MDNPNMGDLPDLQTLKGSLIVFPNGPLKEPLQIP